MQVMCSNEFNRLVIQGQATPEQLDVAWHEIISEYSDVIRTPKTQGMFDAYQRIVVAEFKIDWISEVCRYLKEKYDQTLANLLVEWGYDYIENLEDREAYFRQIYLVESDVKTLIILLNQYHAEYRLLCPTGEGTTNRSLIDYKKDLAILSKYMGYRIEETKITVLDFCAIANLYMEESTKPQTHE